MWIEHDYVITLHMALTSQHGRPPKDRGQDSSIAELGSSSLSHWQAIVEKLQAEVI